MICRVTRRVTLCRDARSERPLYQKLQHRSFNDNGRTDRASLQRVARYGVPTKSLLVRLAGGGGETFF